MHFSMVIASDVNLRFGYLGTSGKARSEDCQFGNFIGRQCGPVNPFRSLADLTGDPDASTISANGLHLHRFIEQRARKGLSFTYRGF